MTVTRKLYTLLCGPTLLNYTIPIVMAYLVTGTIAQKYIGLYQATHIFFAAPIVWIGGAIPLPGMPIFLGIIFINLTFKLVFKSPWTMRNSGIILTHISVLLLLLGGLFTALFSSEGYIALGEGEQKSIISDYHMREFVIMDKQGKTLTTLNHKDIKAQKPLPLDKQFPFSIDVHEACENCKIVARENKTEHHIGMAQHMQLETAPPKKNNEENMAGLVFQVTYDDTHKIFVSLEDVPKYPKISVNGKTYKFALRRQHRTLPFSITLLAFKKDIHLGTDMAKAYQSTVLIRDGDMQWESIISMNEPLRYKGYTFFQSSFINTPQGDVSVLAAVWNVGRSFPYISGLTMCVGLIVHLFMRGRSPKKKPKNGKDKHA